MSALANLVGNSAPPLSPELTPKIIAVEPVLLQIARQVPALGPDVDRLNVELKSRMGGLPDAMARMSAAPPPGGMPGSPPLTGTTGMGPGPGGPGGIGPIAALAPAIPGNAPSPVPPMPPDPAANMGALDTAMQLEIKLPAIGQDDPTLMPYIQGFIARMREEVPKVVEGDTEAVSPPQQAAPTESMLSKIPVTY